MHLLADLPDHATVRVVPAEPALSPEQAADISTAIDKLFAQFQREGRIGRWAIEAVAGGTLLVIAYETATPISGCSQDKLAKVLMLHEERSGTKLLSAPPIVVQLDDAPRCLDRNEFRQLVHEGRIGLDTTVLDCRVDTLGAWRARGTTALKNTWVRALLPRRRESEPVV